MMIQKNDNKETNLNIFGLKFQQMIETPKNVWSNESIIIGNVPPYKSI